MGCISHLHCLDFMSLLCFKTISDCFIHYNSFHLQSICIEKQYNFKEYFEEKLFYCSETTILIFMYSHAFSIQMYTYFLQFFLEYNFACHFFLMLWPKQFFIVLHISHIYFNSFIKLTYCNFSFPSLGILLEVCFSLLNTTDRNEHFFALLTFYKHFYIHQLSYLI